MSDRVHPRTAKVFALVGAFSRNWEHLFIRKAVS
jgi:hypothetical protein